MNQEQIKKHIVEMLPSYRDDKNTKGIEQTMNAGHNILLSETHAKLDDIIQYVRGQYADELNAIKLCLEKIKLHEMKREIEAIKEQKVYDASIQSWSITALRYLDEIHFKSTNQK